MTNTPNTTPENSAEAPSLLQQNISYMRSTVHEQIALLLENTKAVSKQATWQIVNTTSQLGEAALDYAPTAAGLAGRGIRRTVITTTKSLGQLLKGLFTEKDILPSNS